jgi:hypothetical protein
MGDDGHRLAKQWGHELPDRCGDHGYLNFKDKKSVVTLQSSEIQGISEEEFMTVLKREEKQRNVNISK